MEFKKSICLGLSLTMLLFNAIPAQAIVESNAKKKPAQTTQKANPIELAFVFDGPSEKNEQVLKTFQQTIEKSLLPDFKASFPKDLIFTGNWSEQSAIDASNKALASRAKMFISLGYMSSMHLEGKKNKTKFIVTIDEYGLRDLGSEAFFNPIKQ